MSGIFWLLVGWCMGPLVLMLLMSLPGVGHWFIPGYDAKPIGGDIAHDDPQSPYFVLK